MTRYPPGHKSTAKARILRSAGQAFRENGFAGVSVDGLMEGAGLSRGGFYGHFDSKEALFGEMIVTAMRHHAQVLFGGLDDLEPDSWLRSVVARYLHPAHRDGVAHGCPMAPLLPEITRMGQPLREDFVAEFERNLECCLARIEPAADLTSRERALAVFSLLLGGLILARATQGAPISDEFLAACSKLATLDSRAGDAGPAEKQGGSK